MAEKAFMESLCELPGEECPKTEPHHWGTDRTELPWVLEQLNEGFGTTRDEQGKEGMVKWSSAHASLSLYIQGKCHCENMQQLLLTDKRKKYEALLKARADGALKKPHPEKLS